MTQDTKTMESEILKRQKIPRMDYDIAKNNIKRIVKLHGKAGILAVTVIGCELSDLFDQVIKEETK